MFNRFLVFVSFTLFTFSSILPLSGKEIKLVSNQKIWQGDKYAAFTSLVFYEGKFYCTFRNANKHYDPSGEDCGSIIIVCSKDGTNWEKYLIFSQKGFDLRDPQLTITPQNKMMLLTEKVYYKEGKAMIRQSCVSIIDSKENHTDLKPIDLKSSPNWNWVWNISWIDGDAYGFMYAPYFGFVKSKDGIHFELLQKIKLTDTPTEASVIKWKRSKYLAIVRRRANALIGVYDTNRGAWKWKDLGFKLGCPKLIKIKNSFYVLGRTYGESKITSLYKLDVKQLSLSHILSIDGESDCAYPGAVYKNGVLYISYYSGNGKQGDVYFAKVKL